MQVKMEVSKVWWAVYLFVVLVFSLPRVMFNYQAVHPVMESLVSIGIALALAELVERLDKNALVRSMIASGKIKMGPVKEDKE